MYLLRSLLLSLCALAAFAQNVPVPFVDEPLVPSAVAPGGSSFTLTVNGGGFESDSVVLWNGLQVATSYVSPERLTAQIPASLIASPETAQITVSSGPKLVSNQAVLQVEETHTVVSFTSDSIANVEPTYFTVGDFNGDGRPDLAAVVSTELINVLLGNGNGSFQAPIVTGPEVSEATQILAADVNGDGDLDLVVLGGRGSYVYLGNGNGTFQARQPLPIPDEWGFRRRRRLQRRRHTGLGLRIRRGFGPRRDPAGQWERDFCGGKRSGFDQLRPVGRSCRSE
jgi:hypothetical protein